MKPLPADYPPLFADASSNFSKSSRDLADEPIEANEPSESTTQEHAELGRISLREPLSLLASAALHAVAIIALSLWLFPVSDENGELSLTASFSQYEDTFDLDSNELSSVGGEFSAEQEIAIELPLADNVADSNIVEPSELLLPTTNAPSTRSASITDAIS